MDMAAQTSRDRTVLNYVLDTFGRNAARVLILAWLWWRFRPFSLAGLATTSIVRFFEASSHKPLQSQ
jgi:hypothetical protein